MNDEPDAAMLDADRQALIDEALAALPREDHTAAIRAMSADERRLMVEESERAAQEAPCRP